MKTCIWVSDDEEDFIEQNMLDAQKMPANLSSPGLPSQIENTKSTGFHLWSI